ncbi:alpha/beta hydrolase [Staphylococcus equorum]|uniref:alpha/beta hydrolase n=1 Tax=Staphylococcus equorum TaxID=246432 RepID=UPI003D8096A5
MEDKKNSRNFYTVLLIILLVVLLSVVILVIKYYGNNEYPVRSDSEEAIPTFYLHGYKGSADSGNFLVNSAIKSGASKEVIQAYVSSDGKVSFDGNLTSKSKYPIIKIKLEDNNNENVEKNAKWIRNAIIATNYQYNFEKFNFVAHSMSNKSFSYYMLNYGDDEQLPTLNKVVNLAGNFNGEVDIDGKKLNVELDKNGKPNKMMDDYKELRAMKHKFPDDVNVLNIYGDIEDGTDSDGRVTNVSSRSLKYLLGDNVKSYDEFKVHGPNAEHGKLANNKKVQDKINEFLWDKDL